MTEIQRIDLRGMPMDPRHALLFGTLFGLQPGESMEVTNDHDPSRPVASPGGGASRPVRLDMAGARPRGLAIPRGLCRGSARDLLVRSRAPAGSPVPGLGTGPQPPRRPPKRHWIDPV